MANIKTQNYYLIVNSNGNDAFLTGAFSKCMNETDVKNAVIKKYKTWERSNPSLEETPETIYPCLKKCSRSLKLLQLWGVIDAPFKDITITKIPLTFEQASKAKWAIDMCMDKGFIMQTIEKLGK